jgi:Transposase DDE domain group 1
MPSRRWIARQSRPILLWRDLVPARQPNTSLPGSAFLATNHATNEVRLWLSVIAYNLGNLWRRLVLPRKIDGWALTGLQQRLVKTSGRLVKHARYYWLLLAEIHLTRRLFTSMVCRIEALPVPAG